MKYKRTLCLNADYQPIQIINIKEAVKSLILEKSEAIHNYEGEFLRSPSIKFPAPSVIRLKEYKKVVYRRVPFTRRNVYLRDNYTCVYTGKKLLNPKHRSIDHVIPKSKGGKDTWENVVTAHVNLNERKGDYILGKDPEVDDLPIPKPYRPHYLLLMQRGPIPKEWKPYLYL